MKSVGRPRRHSAPRRYRRRRRPTPACRPASAPPRPSRSDGAGVEGLDLERAERTVPDQRRAPRASTATDALDRAAGRCRGSCRPPATSSTSTRRATAHWPRTSLATTASTGRTISQSAALASPMMRARGVGADHARTATCRPRRPARARNVLAMAPPMISTSTLAIRLLEQVELGRNLGAADDRGDRPLRRFQRLARARRVRPAWCGRHRRAARAPSPSVEAWARWATEKASLT